MSGMNANALYKGSSLADFAFIDQNIEAKNIGRDINLAHSFKVRGKSYLKDKKKIEAGAPLFRFMGFEFIEVDRAVFGDRHDHIARYGICAQRVAAINSLPDVAHVLVVNIQMPGNPPLSSVAYYAVPASCMQHGSGDCHFDKGMRLYKQFVDIPIAEAVLQQDPSKPYEPVMHTTKKAWGADIVWPQPGSEHPGILPKNSFQNQRFKMVPQMIGAPWIVQAAVGSTPCLLGQKIVQRFYKGHDYFEIDLHVGSSAIADNIVSLCRTYSTAFVCNLGIVIQGETEDELCEALLATVQLHRADLSVRSQLFI